MTEEELLSDLGDQLRVPYWKDLEPDYPPWVEATLVGFMPSAIRKSI